uniref:Uncharacterized protein n=1 Tax=Globisporangium ultimum (strain ATCC 200006 / CBS 805.95 / DAOM BR144) TaxID=431595 RepID=K3X9C4_GLOUD
MRLACVACRQMVGALAPQEEALSDTQRHPSAAADGALHAAQQEQAQDSTSSAANCEVKSENAQQKQDMEDEKVVSTSKKVARCTMCDGYFHIPCLLRQQQEEGRGEYEGVIALLKQLDWKNFVCKKCALPANKSGRRGGKAKAPLLVPAGVLDYLSDGSGDEDDDESQGIFETVEAQDDQTAMAESTNPDKLGDGDSTAAHVLVLSDNEENDGEDEDDNDVVIVCDMCLADFNMIEVIEDAATRAPPPRPWYCSKCVRSLKRARKRKQRISKQMLLEMQIYGGLLRPTAAKVIDVNAAALRGKPPSTTGELKNMFALVGKRVGIFLKWDKHWVMGRVLSFEAAEPTFLHTVRFEDGTEKSLPLYAFPLVVGTSTMVYVKVPILQNQWWPGQLLRLNPMAKKMLAPTPEDEEMITSFRLVSIYTSSDHKGKTQNVSCWVPKYLCRSMDKFNPLPEHFLKEDPITAQTMSNEFSASKERAITEHRMEHAVLQIGFLKLLRAISMEGEDRLKQLAEALIGRQLTDSRLHQCPGHSTSYGNEQSNANCLCAFTVSSYNQVSMELTLERDEVEVKVDLTKASSRYYLQDSLHYAELAVRFYNSGIVDAESGHEKETRDLLNATVNDMPISSDPDAKKTEPSGDNLTSTEACCSLCLLPDQDVSQNSPDKLNEELVTCVKCAKCFHLECCDPPHDPTPLLNEEDGFVLLEDINSPFICSKCISCAGCSKSVTDVEAQTVKSPGWSQWRLPLRVVSLCADCVPFYEVQQYCSVCLEVLGDEALSTCIELYSCSNCHHWVHAKCEPDPHPVFLACQSSEEYELDVNVELPDVASFKVGDGADKKFDDLDESTSNSLVKSTSSTSTPEDDTSSEINVLNGTTGESKPARLVDEEFALSLKFKDSYDSKILNKYECLTCRKARMLQVVYRLKAEDKLELFKEPVTRSIAPTYFDVIKNPMDLSTIQKKILRNEYSRLNFRDFRDDFELMCLNAVTFNSKERDFLIWREAWRFYGQGQKIFRQTAPKSRMKHRGGKYYDALVTAAKRQLPNNSSIGKKQLDDGTDAADDDFAGSVNGDNDDEMDQDGEDERENGDVGDLGNEPQNTIKAEEQQPKLIKVPTVIAYTFADIATVAIMEHQPEMTYSYDQKICFSCSQSKQFEATVIQEKSKALHQVWTADARKQKKDSEKCPLCKLRWNPDDEDLIQCDACELWAHPKCDSLLTEEPDRYKKLVEDPSALYICGVCRPKERLTLSNIPNSWKCQTLINKIQEKRGQLDIKWKEARSQLTQAKQWKYWKDHTPVFLYILRLGEECMKNLAYRSVNFQENWFRFTKEQELVDNKVVLPSWLVQKASRYLRFKRYSRGPKASLRRQQRKSSSFYSQQGIERQKDASAISTIVSEACSCAALLACVHLFYGWRPLPKVVLHLLDNDASADQGREGLSEQVLKMLRLENSGMTLDEEIVMIKKQYERRIGKKPREQNELDDSGSGGQHYHFPCAFDFGVVFLPNGETCCPKAEHMEIVARKQKQRMITADTPATASDNAQVQPETSSVETAAPDVSVTEPKEGENEDGGRAEDEPSGSKGDDASEGIQNDSSTNDEVGKNASESTESASNAAKPETAVAGEHAEEDQSSTEEALSPVALSNITGTITTTALGAAGCAVTPTAPSAPVLPVIDPSPEPRRHLRSDLPILGSDPKKKGGSATKSKRQQCYRLGALTVHSLGHIVVGNPTFHSRDAIYPLGFRSTRIFWSSRSLETRCLYECVITNTDIEERAKKKKARLVSGHNESESSPNNAVKTTTRAVFKIVASDDQDHPIVAFSPDDALIELRSRVVALYEDHHCFGASYDKNPFLNRSSWFSYGLSGGDFFGFSLPDIVKEIEQLPHAATTSISRSFVAKKLGQSSAGSRKRNFSEMMDGSKSLSYEKSQLDIASRNDDVYVFTQHLPTAKQFEDALHEIEQLMTKEERARLSTGSTRTDGYEGKYLQHDEAPRAVRRRLNKHATTAEPLAPSNTTANTSNSATSNSTTAPPSSNGNANTKASSGVAMDLEHLPIAMQYRELRRRPFDERLEVRKSKIHGYGLFTKEKFAEGQMIVEYQGQMIAQDVADEREKFYEEIGIGSCYMFRLDEKTIIDATRVGNLARFINHSCDPKAFARVVTVEGNEKKIVIFAKRAIEAGDEVTRHE